MSRIGKQTIKIPEKVDIDMKGQKIKVKGPKGKLSFDITSEIKVKEEDGKIVVEPKAETKRTPALWGTTRALIFNMIYGVTKGYKKNLEIQGLGYKASKKGDSIVLDVGLSHSVKLEVPEDIEIEVNKKGKKITVSGIDKQLVGQFAAKIKKTSPPEPYKGKGIRYEGEEVRRKEGKKAMSEE
ncbi:MAG: 50S ribosomal protein L6 [Minisyncoccales bacterium]